VPQDKNYEAIAAGATVNVLAGRLFERVGGRGAMIRAYACTTDGVNGELVSTFIVGSDVLALNQGLRLNAAGPIVPEDQIVSGPSLPGDQLQWNIQNTDAVNPTTVGWLLDVENI